jgi:hypothetical protein
VGTRGIAACVINLRNGWRIVLSFTILLALPSGKSLRYLVSRRLGVPKNLPEGFGEGISSLHQLEI